MERFSKAPAQTGSGLRIVSKALAKMGDDFGSVSKRLGELGRSCRSVSTVGANGFAKAEGGAFNTGMKITGSSGLFPSLADLRLFGRTLKERLKDFSPLCSFRLVPKTKADWERFLLFPFKAYVLLAVPVFSIMASVTHWRQRDASHSDTQFIGFGYFLCFLMLFYGAVRQWTQGLQGPSIVTFIFTALAFLGAVAFQGL